MHLRVRGGFIRVVLNDLPTELDEFGVGKRAFSSVNLLVQDLDVTHFVFAAA